MFGYIFDPDYFVYGEDVDLGLRIRLTGKKVMFEPKSIIYHMHSVTMQKQRKSFSTYLMERNLIITFFKIFSLKNIILYLPYIKLMRFITIIKDILSLRLDLALARLKALLWVLINFNKILKKRNKTQKFRKAGDEYILKVFSEKYIFKTKFNVWPYILLSQFLYWNKPRCNFLLLNLVFYPRISTFCQGWIFG